MRRIENLVEYVAQQTLGTTKVTFKGHEIDLKAPWKRVKLVDELKEFELWTKDYADLKQRLESRGVDVSNDKTWSQLVDKAVTAYVEPRLIEPTILYDYPIELSPFARVTDDDPEIVERFEFFIGGMELGNAFTELNDAAEQAERFAMQAEEGAGGNVEAEQGDPDYVDALSYGMPPTGGLGLGIDRLAMVLAGKDSIRDVILFPAQRQRD
jgi:lysyl-tRNA synthetase class 2